MRNSLLALRLCLSTAFKAAPLLAVVDTLVVVLTAAAAPLQAYGVKLLVDGLTGVGSGTSVTGVVIVAVALAVSFAGLAVNNALTPTLSDRVDARLHADLLALTTKIPGIAHHERSDLADKIALVQQQSREMTWSAGHVMYAVTALTNVSTVGVLLWSVHPGLLVLPLLALLRVWARVVNVRMFFAVVERTTPQFRLADRLLSVVEAPAHAMELRVFGLGTFLLDRIGDLFGQRFREQRRVVRNGAAIEALIRLGFGLAYGAAIGWVVYLARGGQVTAGDVALVVLLAPQVDQAAGRVAASVHNLVQMAKLFGNYVWLRTYARTHGWRDGTEPAPTAIRSAIEFRNVAFLYPGTDRPALQDVNLALPAGSTVALVGENGAGKSTLVKLLARLYDPDEGQVLVDGRDLRSMDPSAWRSRVAAGFQDFVRFAFTARETVGVGDVDRIKDRAAVAKALERGDATAVVERLPSGLDTQLGRDFSEGHELSGGQWQRLALARAFMRDEPLLLLLDEPTAALDPEAEHALFERFTAASKAAAHRSGGVTVLVSHRFSTVRMADLIVVLHDGQVEEMGSHEELLARAGRYAHLFELQARAYR
ncbi:ABC transporter ATP-binding protein [Actinopolymorpha alba]|uniref:ABC transporter ATP-binding protein n=1 Tax=Actinopolymorpha alba TaxID=533267 RepID=UPI0003A5A5B5|nr:ABC transporter ATP-binding protein [Actinopolymorpha alba]